MLHLTGLIQEPLESLENIEESKPIGFEDSLKYGGLPFPVISGSEKPLFRKVKTAAHIHGESGLDTFEPVEFPTIPKHALEFTRRLASQKSPHFTTRMYDYFGTFEPDNKIVILAIGPLTNIALLLINHPDVVKYIDKIVVMGGSIGVGNVGPGEFNISADPEAASYVFESGVDIYLVINNFFKCLNSLSYNLINHLFLWFSDSTRGRVQSTGHRKNDRTDWDLKKSIYFHTNFNA